MKIYALGDMHGHLPRVPECDLVLIAGDMSPGSLSFKSLKWFEGAFRKWLESIDAPVVATPGNHDFIYGKDAHLTPDLPMVVLIDDVLLQLVDGHPLSIFGCPHTIEFFNWDFMLPENKMEEHVTHFPQADIWLLHGPPYQYGDWSPFSKSHTGSIKLVEMIIKKQPKLVVYGHLHSGFGQWKIGNSIVANVSLVNENYEMVREPVKFEL